MEADLGVGNVPAYRGFGYVVFNRLPLERFGNALPSITVEVVAEGELQSTVTELGAEADAIYAGACMRADGKIVAISKPDPMIPRARASLINPETGAVELQVDDLPDIDSAGMFVSGSGVEYIPPINVVCYATSGALMCYIDADTLTLVHGGRIHPDSTRDPALGYDPVDTRTYVSTDGYGITTGGQEWTLAQQSLNINIWARASLGAFYPNWDVGVGAPDNLAIIANPSGMLGQILSRYARVCWDGTRGRYVAADADGNVWTVDDIYAEGTTEDPVPVTQVKVGGTGSNANSVIYDPGVDVILILYGPAGNLSFRVLDAETFDVVHEDSFVSDLGVTRAFLSPNESGKLIVCGNFQPWEMVYYGTTVGAAVARLCEESGLEAADYDVSELTQRLRGYTVSQQGPARPAIEQLAQVFFFDGVEQDDQIYYRRRGGPVVAEITRDELGAEFDAHGEVAKEQTRGQELELPARVSITAPDPFTDHQPGTQYFERLARHAGEEQTTQVAVVLSATENKRTAAAMVFDAWASRYRQPASTLREYSRLVPTDPIRIDGRRVRIVNKTDEGGLLRFECVSDDPDVLDQVTVGVQGEFPGQEVATVVPTNMIPLDIALLRDVDDDPGFYVAGWGMMPAWRGGVIYTSADSGATWTRAATIPRPGSGIGYAANALGNWPGGNFFDEKNSLTVSMSNGATESRTRLAVYNGGGAIAVESTVDGETVWEVLQYRDSTVNGDGTETLTGFLRGRCGTEEAMGGHAIGDRVVLLTTGTIRNVEIDSSVIGVERPYRPVSIGDTIDQTAEQELTINAERLVPRSPVHLGGGRNASGDVILKWIRRTRVGGEWRDSVDASLGEDSEAYVVRIYTNAARTTVVRTISGLSSQTTTYTAAQQSSDFGGLQSTVYWDVRQVSATVGNGHAANGTT